MDIQNRLRNGTMAKANKTTLENFSETVIWRLLVPINTYMVEPQNEFTGDTAPTVLYYSGVQVPVKHAFNETFEREKSDGGFVGKCHLYYIC